jgi:hypothetical protein
MSTAALTPDPSPAAQERGADAAGERVFALPSPASAGEGSGVRAA